MDSELGLDRTQIIIRLKFNRPRRVTAPRAGTATRIPATTQRDSTRVHQWTTVTVTNVTLPVNLKSESEWAIPGKKIKTEKQF